MDHGQVNGTALAQGFVAGYLGHSEHMFCDCEMTRMGAGAWNSLMQVSFQRNIFLESSECSVEKVRGEWALVFEQQQGCENTSVSKEKYRA